MSKCITYLIYHVDKGLCVILKEVTDCVTFVPARGNGLQEGEFIQSKPAPDQTSTDWSVEVEK